MNIFPPPPPSPPPHAPRTFISLVFPCLSLSDEHRRSPLSPDANHDFLRPVRSWYAPHRHFALRLAARPPADLSTTRRRPVCSVASVPRVRQRGEGVASVSCLFYRVLAVAYAVHPHPRPFVAMRVGNILEYLREGFKFQLHVDTPYVDEKSSECCTGGEGACGKGGGLHMIMHAVTVDYWLRIQAIPGWSDMQDSDGQVAAGGEGGGGGYLTLHAFSSCYHGRT